MTLPTDPPKETLAKAAKAAKKAVAQDASDAKLDIQLAADSAKYVIEQTAKAARSTVDRRKGTERRRGTDRRIKSRLSNRRGSVSAAAGSMVALSTYASSVIAAKYRIPLEVMAPIVGAVFAIAAQAYNKFIFPWLD